MRKIKKKLENGIRQDIELMAVQMKTFKIKLF